MDGDGGERVGGEALDVAVELFVELLQEEIGEQNRIAFTFAQRRHVHPDLVQPIIQILAEAAGADEVVDILIGGADDAHIDLDRAVAADALDHLVVQESQQLHLHRQRHVADLVEKQRPTVGAFDLADRLLDSAGEGAFLVTEQLAFQQGLGDRRAIEGDEGLLGARAEAVDRLG